MAKPRDLRRFLDQPIAEIVQCGEPTRFASWQPRPVSSSRRASLTRHASGLESSPRSQLIKIFRINYLRDACSTDLVSLLASDICDAQAALDDVRNWLARALFAAQNSIITLMASRSFIAR